jgi:acetyl-CoA C-acetyltransferase
MLVQTGQFSIVAVEAHSKASNNLNFSRIIGYAQDPVLNRPLRFNSHFVAGMDMKRYLHRTDTTLEDCAQVVVKNRANALANPFAPFGADLSVEHILAGDPLAWPLSYSQTAKHADGAIVMVLASQDRAEALSGKPIWITAVGWCNGSAGLENRSWGEALEVQDAAGMAFRHAGIRNPVAGIDFAEVDDIYAFRELLTLESLGFFRPGEARFATADGTTASGGALPVNTSGGSLGFGDLLDANGLARALEVVLQLRGEAGSRQIEGVNTGLAQSWRGVPTTSTAVVIMQN